MNDATPADTGAVRTRESLLARARGLMETVRERTDETEETRRLAPETMQAMREAGIHRILQPARHGGAEAHFSGMADIVEAISVACSAAGWCLTQYCSHNCLLGYWPPEGQDEIWDTTPDAMVCGRADPELRPGRAGARRLANQRALAVRERRLRRRLVHRDGVHGGRRQAEARPDARRAPGPVRDHRHLAHCRLARHRQPRRGRRRRLRAGTAVCSLSTRRRAAAMRRGVR